MIILHVRTQRGFHVLITYFPILRITSVSILCFQHCFGFITFLFNIFDIIDNTHKIGVDNVRFTIISFYKNKSIGNCICFCSENSILGRRHFIFNLPLITANPPLHMVFIQVEKLRFKFVSTC